MSLSNPEILKVGSRKSPLALVQVREVFELLEKAGVRQAYDLLTFETQGDVDKKTSLTSQPADDFFTDTIDRALLQGIADVGIHSAKDLPQKIPQGLMIFAITQTLDGSDCWVSPYAFKDLPKGGRVGTSSLLRQQMIKEMRPDIVCVDVRGTIQERITLVEEGSMDGIIVATCAMKRLNLANKIKEILPWEATPLQGQLAVVGRADDHATQKLFAAIDVRKNYGRVYLVGAGPGDPKLITLKGVETLKGVDCVFYDYLIDSTLLKHAPQAEHIYVGKRKGAHALSQSELNEQLRQKAMVGKSVARLKGGDPLVFGRGAEEIDYLRKYQIQVEVVPGVSSATGIPSSLGIPLTARGLSSSVAFVSAHGEEEVGHDPQPIVIPSTDTIVFLMGLTKLPQIVQELKNKGWKADVPIAVISRGTKNDEVVLKGTLTTILEQVKAAAILPPALIIAGPTVNFYDAPASDQQVLYLGTMPENYKSLGRLIHFPMIAIAPCVFNDAQKQEIVTEFDRADVVLLTSCHAVTCLMNLLQEKEIVFEKEFTVIGQNTSHVLESYGIKPKIIAAVETSEGMFEELKRQMDLKGKNIFFPRSALSNPYLKTHLEKEGAQVTERVVYDNIKPAKRPLPPVDAIDSVIFTSPSTVKNFLEDYAKIPASWKILSKGPATSRALTQAGYGSTEI